jgi:hypothetical protein
MTESTAQQAARIKKANINDGKMDSEIRQVDEGVKQ